MSENDQKNTYKKFVLFVAGFFVVVLGVTLILAWWPAVVALFKGATGIVLALAGLLMLYGMNKL